MSALNFTAFDLIFLLIVGLAAALGFMRGFVQELMALAAWIVALFALHFLHTPLTGFLAKYLASDSGAAVLAFALLLLVPYVIMKAMATWAGALTRKSAVAPIDRVLGMGFGGIKGLILVVLAMSVMFLGTDSVWGPTGRPTWITSARTYPFVNASSDQLLKMLAERRARLIRESRLHSSK